MDYEKLGIVITTHGNNGIYIQKCVELFLNFFPNSFIILYVNESNDPITLNIKKKFKNINYIYVKDQIANGGLTSTWNQGIDLCIKHECDVIILSNDDIIINKSIYNIVNNAFEDVNGLKYFGPVSNNPGGRLATKLNQLSNKATSRKNKLCKYKGTPCYLNGFFMVFHKNALIRNKFNQKFYFDPNYPFGGNEVEWFNRFKSKGGSGVVVPRTFVYHYKFNIWKKNGINIRMKRIRNRKNKKIKGRTPIKHSRHIKYRRNIKRRIRIKYRRIIKRRIKNSIR